LSGPYLVIREMTSFSLQYSKNNQTYYLLFYHLINTKNKYFHFFFLFIPESKECLYSHQRYALNSTNIRHSDTRCIIYITKRKKETTQRYRRSFLLLEKQSSNNNKFEITKKKNLSFAFLCWWWWCGSRSRNLQKKVNLNY